jgi:hypothetical protein
MMRTALEGKRCGLRSRPRPQLRPAGSPAKAKRADARARRLRG